MKKIIAALVLLFASFGFAQVPGKGNIYVGYSFIHFPDDNTNGWNGSLEGRVLPFMSLVADFNGAYRSTTVSDTLGTISTDLLTNIHTHTFLFGPRLSKQVGGVRPFAHALIGVGRTSGDFVHRTFVNGVEFPEGTVRVSSASTNFATAIGGGADIRVARSVYWRVQSDYLRLYSTAGGSNSLRFSTGLAYHF